MDKKIYRKGDYVGDGIPSYYHNFEMGFSKILEYDGNFVYLVCCYAPMNGMEWYMERQKFEEEYGPLL